MNSVIEYSSNYRVTYLPDSQLYLLYDLTSDADYAVSLEAMNSMMNSHYDESRIQPIIMKIQSGVEVILSPKSSEALIKIDKVETPYDTIYREYLTIDEINNSIQQS